MHSKYDETPIFERRHAFTLCAIALLNGIEMTSGSPSTLGIEMTSGSPSTLEER